MFRLKLIFCLAASSIVAIEPISGEDRPYRWNNRAPNIFTKEFYEIKKNYEEYKNNRIRMELREISTAKPEDRKELLRTSPNKDVHIVDLNKPQSQELITACTTPKLLPLTLHPHHFRAYSYVHMNYDINEHGYPVNIKISKTSKSTNFEENTAMADMLRTKFQPPALGEQKLFCTNAIDSFYRHLNGIFYGVKVTRISNGLHKRELSN